ncbi:hypothetical protein [Caballeronia mineralivorans]|jgi:hypothetical protein|uniref:hypothetical protein n=1 Tax=Caballeronia mineralivorans TaxID=2010198 RepID=UPI002AFF6FED|nr:hypothetical protein [Caballeronia mineralivorans]MEA3105389.1 hypothetical protein [Caballeronia mineralivorans]
MANSKTAQIAVLHVPHSSRHVHAEKRQTILLDDAVLNRELLRMTDAYKDELFPFTPVESARYPAQRTSSKRLDLSVSCQQQTPHGAAGACELSDGDQPIKRQL